MDKEPLYMRPHHVEGAQRYLAYGKEQTKQMYDLLTDALAKDPDAEMQFVSTPIDPICLDCINATRGQCKGVIGEGFLESIPVKVDEDVAREHAWLFDRTYKVKDILAELKKEARFRTLFQITFDMQKSKDDIDKWRQDVRASKKWAERSPEPKEPAPIENLGIDFEPVMNKAIAATGKVLAQYNQANEASDGVESDNPDVWKKRIVLTSEVIDESVPLSFVAYKTYSKDKHSGENYTSISFHIMKGQSDEISDSIAGLEFVDNEGNFDLIDREVKEKFRRQGLAWLLHFAADKFFADIANNAEKPVHLSANAAQFDVITWLTANDYSPKTQSDADKLNKVKTADDSLIMGDDNYIFEKDKVSEDERIIKLDDGRLIPNRHNAYRIDFAREIKPN